MARTKQSLTKRIRPKIPQSRYVKPATTQNSETDSAKFPLVPNKVKTILSSASKPKGIQRINGVPAQSKPNFAVYSIPKLAFQRLCRDIAYKQDKACRFTKEALTALQTAAEDLMVGIFEDAGLCMLHANRKTLMRKDMEMVLKLRKINYEPL